MFEQVLLHSAASAFLIALAGLIVAIIFATPKPEPEEHVHDETLEYDIVRRGLVRSCWLCGPLH